MNAGPWTCSICATLHEASASSCAVCSATPGAAEAPRVPLATIERGTAPPAPPVPAPEPNRVPPPAASTIATPDPAPSGSQGRGLFLPLVAVVLLVGVVGVGFAVIGSSGNGRTDAAPVSTVTSTPSGPSPTQRPSTTIDPFTTTASTTTLPPSRPGRLHAGVAVLRDAPDLAAREVRRIEGRDGVPVEVIEEATVDQPWYRLRIDGSEGYMFGAFVLPPAPGLCVAVASGTPRFYNDLGQTIHAEASGEKVLITGFEANGAYPAVLPGGQRGFVSNFDVGSPTCG